MSCEMCGNFAGPDLVETEIDGVRMFVCPKCAKFGTRVSDKPSYDDTSESEYAFVRDKPGGQGTSVSRVKVQTGTQRSTASRPRPRRDGLYTDEVLVEDYGEVIKNARMARGLSLEDFAQMINEKASMLRKIEKSEFTPPESVVVKIERRLEISLKEEAAAPIYSGTSSQKETTLGDVVKLKKKKK
ncbi:MAG: TIGR00270 family protein [Asgard group archaeon]|nr:TIGR00270 family protein [Asgard group archaeon]